MPLAILSNALTFPHFPNGQIMSLYLIITITLTILTLIWTCKQTLVLLASFAYPFTSFISFSAVIFHDHSVSGFALKNTRQEDYMLINH